jgi:hypothetical protein
MSDIYSISASEHRSRGGGAERSSRRTSPRGQDGRDYPPFPFPNGRRFGKSSPSAFLPFVSLLHRNLYLLARTGSCVRVDGRVTDTYNDTSDSVWSLD